MRPDSVPSPVRADSGPPCENLCIFSGRPPESQPTADLTDSRSFQGPAQTVLETEKAEPRTAPESASSSVRSRFATAPKQAPPVDPCKRRVWADSRGSFFLHRFGARGSRFLRISRPPGLTKANWQQVSIRFDSRGRFENFWKREAASRERCPNRNKCQFGFVSRPPLKILANVRRRPPNRPRLDDLHFSGPFARPGPKFWKTKRRAARIAANWRTSEFRSRSRERVENFGKRNRPGPESQRIVDVVFFVAVQVRPEIGPAVECCFRVPRGGLDTGISLAQLGRGFACRAHGFGKIAGRVPERGPTADLAQFDAVSGLAFSALENEQARGLDRGRPATSDNWRRFGAALKWRE
jgi:hypothetical protein